MTRIDFLFGAKHRLNAACEVVHQNYLDGRTVIVYTQDQRRLNRFNNLLWSFSRTSFIPHTFCTDTTQNVPVILTLKPPALIANSKNHKPVLLNLDLECPPQANNFELILEIVSNHEDDKTAARNRWLAYKQAGYEVHGRQW